MSMKSVYRIGLPFVIAAVLAGCGVPEQSADAPTATAAPSPAGMPWVAKGDDWQARKAELQALGEQFETSLAMYEKLKADAGGGKSLTWEQLALPAYDWSGIYTRTGGGLSYDPDLAGPGGPPPLPSEAAAAGPPPPRPDRSNGPASAQLTPEGLAAVKAKAAAMAKTGGEYDPLSDCSPPGTPRWFTEPFLKEYIVTPSQTLLINEMVNDVRRVYTDGRPHTSEADAYGTPNGDTIGFWDGDILVTHTAYLMAGQYQRGIQPNYSDQVTTVERWRKVDDKTLEADVWVFDPVNLAKPWYTRQSSSKLSNDDYNLRIRYWNCSENPNNDIIKKEDGTSQFTDFSFVPNDAAVSNDADVKKAASSAKP